MGAKIARSTMKRRGGYEAGSKLVSELKPPPKTPGAGSKPAAGSGKK